MNNYPHMCRDDHIEIGHSDGEHEQCPLCRAIAVIGIFCGYDERFQVAVGGNPIAIDKMMADVHQLLRELVGGTPS